MITVARKTVLATIISVFVTHNAAAEIGRIEVMALLGSKAMISVDGQNHLLAVGESSEEGIKLLAIEQEGVQLDVSGKIDFYALGSTRIGTQYTQPEKLQERVYRDNSGMYRSVGSINGHMVSFLVDTGATTIAINSREAKRLGINYLLDGQMMAVNTASGTVRAWAVKLDRVTLGKIELNNIPAAVIDGSSLQEVLLGMSFLERLNVQHQGEVMLLETKF
ncbi:MAG: TIGR02281 family clan AA aspartic protease [Gammaproteobacteria bacterium]|nr:TIGR02281 family clan AA aspartic protease [Gammaproteobacteria bacterium]